MSNETWNKITKTHDLFKKIIAPLKQHLAINFGYMIVFKDGSYYQIIEDLECLKKWVTNVETSSIFCARNVTTYFDYPYNFTIWPEEPTCPAMEIYKEHGMWNGITVSKVTKDYTELYWFTKENTEDGWHKWFIRNKFAIYEYIKYFQKHSNDLYITLNNKEDVELFRFKHAFNYDLPKSEYIKDELSYVSRMINSLRLNPIIFDKIQKEIKFSPRELEVIWMVRCGHSYKAIAQKLCLSERTIRFHIENIKSKTGLYLKVELIQLYENQLAFNSDIS